MSTKRATLAGAIAAALLMLFGAHALARGHFGGAPGKGEPVDSPHGRFTDSTDYCVGCHGGTHAAEDDSLTTAQTERGVCLQCHGGQDTRHSDAADVLKEYEKAGPNDPDDSFGHRVPPSSAGEDQDPEESLPDPVLQSCTDCHTPHQDPEENPGLLRARVFNPENGNKIWLHNSTEEPIGNAFCYACHGPRDSTVEVPPPVPYGDFTAFEAGAHSDLGQMQKAWEEGAEVVEAEAASEDEGTERDDDVDAGRGSDEDVDADDGSGDGAGGDLGQPGGTADPPAHRSPTGDQGAPGKEEPPGHDAGTGGAGVVPEGDGHGVPSGEIGGDGGADERRSADEQAETGEDPKADDEGAGSVTGEIVCLYCHSSHDSSNDGMTTAEQETLCFRCHTREDPNTSDGSSPYRSFNVGVNAYDDEDTRREEPVTIYHHPIAEGEQQDGARRVECVSCHNPHFDSATNLGDNAQVANPRNTLQAWPQSATKRGDPAAVARAVGAKMAEVGLPSAFDGSEPVTYGRWAKALLSVLEAPSCRDNLVTVVAWESQEGTAATWNPLATTYALQGAASINDSGVRDYASMAQGLEATRRTLVDAPSSYGYGPIVSRLQRCAPASATAEAINASSWCEGCTDGGYLTEMIDLVEDAYASYSETVVPGAASSFAGSVETVNDFCMRCHVAPDVTKPIKRGLTVPYGVRMVNDEQLDPGGKPHDMFVAEDYAISAHSALACTDCHDVHGTSNAYNLKAITVPADDSQMPFVGFTGRDNPEDRQRYATFCLSCHADTAADHVGSMVEQGAYCRECHYHGAVEF